MAVSISHYVKRMRVPVQYTWLTWLVRSILLVGPLVGPVFSRIGWPILGLINWPLYLMGENVCPQPDLVFQVLGAVRQVGMAGTPAQREKAQEVLRGTRRSLYQILAEEDAPGDEPGGTVV